MEPSSIRKWSEVVGLLAVVASLIFVGLEVRQNADATKAATAQSLNDSWLEWNLAMSNPEAWSAVFRLYDLADLSSENSADAAAVRSLMRSVFQHWSNLHWQYLQGQLDQRLWDGVVRDMEKRVNTPKWNRLMEWTWEIEGDIYHEDFQRLFDDMLAQRVGG